MTEKEDETIKRAFNTFMVGMKRQGMDYETAERFWGIAFTAGKIAYTYKAEENNKKSWKKIFGCIGCGVVMTFFIGCGVARSGDRPSTERVLVTDPGTVCYLFRDESGKAVGGSCVRDR